MRYLIGLITLVSLVGCNSKGYYLAFASDRDDALDIYLTKNDEDDVVNLTNSPSNEYNMTWTKDGREIYYTSYEKDGRKVKRVNLKTKTVATILSDSTVLSVSDVSKDARVLIISTTEDHPKGELYLYDLETGMKTRLTRNEFYESGAKFSTNEKSIIASIQIQAGDSVNHSGIAEIFEITTSNFNLNKLTDLKGFNALPEYSPNGEFVAFHHCDNGICDIMLMNSDGSDLINLTKGMDDNRWPRWSPDGKWIAFTKTIEKNSDIYFISLDGEVLMPVITSEFRDEIAVFKPR